MYEHILYLQVLKFMEVRIFSISAWVRLSYFRQFTMFFCLIFFIILCFMRLMRLSLGLGLFILGVFVISFRVLVTFWGILSWLAVLLRLRLRLFEVGQVKL